MQSSPSPLGQPEKEKNCPLAQEKWGEPLPVKEGGEGQRGPDSEHCWSHPSEGSTSGRGMIGSVFSEQTTSR